MWARFRQPKRFLMKTLLPQKFSETEKLIFMSFIIFNNYTDYNQLLKFADHRLVASHKCRTKF